MEVIEPLSKGKHSFSCKDAVSLNTILCVCEGEKKMQFHGKAHMMECRVTGSHVNVSALREFTLDYVRCCARP